MNLILDLKGGLRYGWIEISMFNDIPVYVGTSTYLVS